jgi:hypothetical protein
MTGIEIFQVIVTLLLAGMMALAVYKMTRQPKI